MPNTSQKMRAIDLYSGVGGWSLGLRLAGIDVIASYERWGLANETNFKNNQHQAQTVDIRRLALSELPKNVDIVVGSPPCTQFSYSNRGGNGDLADGLQDIIKFLSIVDYLKPKLWAMENVPRVTKVIEKELQPGGKLEQFQHLNISTKIINMEEFGLPQRRKRCIAGNIDFALLESYKAYLPRRTLGEIITALTEENVLDPIYGINVRHSELRDHVVEDVLSAEEVRINRANKTCHPVYNSMAFPDPLNKSVRTITATCTRVSRESIVIEAPHHENIFRRLTIRERAALQGFPINFQFYGETYGQKIKMVGNAVPPAFSYYVAQAILGKEAKDVPSLSSLSKQLTTPNPLSQSAKPEKPGIRYLTNRTFRFAIPSLRLKSGVRFELSNSFIGEEANWKAAFFFGTSKSIHSLELNAKTVSFLLKHLSLDSKAAILEEVGKLIDRLKAVDFLNLQRVWNHTGPSGTHPFSLLDTLDQAGNAMISALIKSVPSSSSLVSELVKQQYKDKANSLPGLSKLEKNAHLVLAGVFVCATANDEIDKRMENARAQAKLLVCN
ncbi:TPA: DNA cytosine methyltransferase [Pseudomonas aeruginosa]|uniref:Cytosine-specific methyltransferase n=1 Tax=Pseudomonas fluorescens TaxID=294 RepID=A0A448BXM9_PSEFL|nr:MULTISPECIES: DNA (cytosine-5-)-methyltransferase [Pseudomonas]VEE50074.1 DNA-cytosine methyltransferase [Pseudomonas fluorescens]EIX9399514.1 DNA (cytosine-5-)-methyltransferase [Pseudomonas aeruginosa]MBN5481457.1 DNA (cytosine-5-)-methyltransferase [Pseudomonas aeruginosa]MCO3466224.1 DNA (cytosine-5-)-methyltransferase [Pseudomonas aeruginosa]MCO3477275.1 DNA (cytosine-5-)-methyltransferase [Pseudomonas aeruginosa]